MTIKALCKELAKREGLKKQVDIAQISELIGHLSDMVYETPSEVVTPLMFNGSRRAKRKVRKGK